MVKKAIDKQKFNEKKKVLKSNFLYQGTELMQICSKSYNAVHSPYS